MVPTVIPFAATHHCKGPDCKGQSPSFVNHDMYVPFFMFQQDDTIPDDQEIEQQQQLHGNTQGESSVSVTCFLHKFNLYTLCNLVVMCIFLNCPPKFVFVFV